MRDAFPSEYLDLAVGSRLIALYGGLCLCGGLRFAGDFFVGQVNKAEVKQQDTEGGNGFILGFHNRFYCVLILMQRKC